MAAKMRLRKDRAASANGREDSMVDDRRRRMMPALAHTALRTLAVLAIAAGAGSAAAAQALVLEGARVYSSPAAAALDNMTVVTSGATITAIGRRGDVQIPEGSRVIECAGKTVVLDGDPVSDVHNLAAIAWTIRAGKVIYQK